MKSALKKLLHTLYVFSIPVLSILFLELVFYLPRHSSFYNFLRFTPFYTGLYFWLSMRHDVFNIFSIFILGIFADVIGASTLGINLLTFLFFYIISLKFFSIFNIRNFLYSWLLFSFGFLLTLLFKLISISLMHQSLVPLNFVFFEYVLTIGLYPIIARFYLFIEHKFIHLEERYENQ